MQFLGAHAHLVDAKAFAAFLAPLGKKRWFVYAKRPFAGPKAVLAYLSRYTHRDASPNRRLIAVDQHSVMFKVKNYRIEGPCLYTTMILDVREFIRRFLIHVLPKGFHRIRHYGLFASANRAETIARARELWGWQRLWPKSRRDRSSGGAATRPALPMLWQSHVRHGDLRGRLPTTLPADGNEDLYLKTETAARREFAEELGPAASLGPSDSLGEIRQRGGKRVIAFGGEGDCDTASLSSNTFEIEWSPGSGRLRALPEVDRAEWFDLEATRSKILSEQVELVDRLAAKRT